MSNFGNRKDLRARLASLAVRQHGRISTAQLHRLGLSNVDICHWCEQGYLTRVLPRVYAVGHVAPDRYADLWAAVLYAGPGAMVSHATAAQLLGLIDYAPQEIEATTAHQVRSLPGRVRVYGRRTRERDFFHGIPVSGLADVIVDVAATGTPQMARRALRQLDYRRKLTPELIAAIDEICRCGRAGSKLTRRLLARHRPQDADANGDLEQFFLDLCSRWRLPMPECNVDVHGHSVDAYWPEAKLVVEVDGGGNHSTEAQVDEDRTRDLDLRAHGLIVLRYSKRQLAQDLGPVRKDLTAHIKQRQLSTEGGKRRRAA